MKYGRFNEVLETTIQKCVDTLGVKADEYATEDRLHNFKVAAEIQNCTPITALAGMMAKHTVSVYDLIQKQEQGYVVSREMWDEKIGDSINYLILLSALVQERFDDAEYEANIPTDSSVDVVGLKEYIEREVKEQKAISENLNSHDAADNYKTGYAHGKNAGASEIARTVSLYLGCGDAE